MGAIRVGVRVIGINDDVLGRLGKGVCIFLQEKLAYLVEGLAVDVIFQTCHSGLRAEVVVRGCAADGHFQRTVVTKPVTVVGILVATKYLGNALADHLCIGVAD